jgi:hypothetical protein
MGGGIPARHGLLRGVRRRHLGRGDARLHYGAGPGKSAVSITHAAQLIDAAMTDFIGMGTGILRCHRVWWTRKARPCHHVCALADRRNRLTGVMEARNKSNVTAYAIGNDALVELCTLCLHSGVQEGGAGGPPGTAPP